MNKKLEFDNLITEMGKCKKCNNLSKISKGTIVDCSLINIFKNEEICKNIPSIWTDWYNRLSSKIFVVGQDWGPESDMMFFYNRYKELCKKNKNDEKENWSQIISEEKSITKKMLTKFLIKSAYNNNYIIDNKYLDKIYITNAIMCARRGSSYRDTTYFKVKDCTLNCTEFLKKQIEIIGPKVILTLGYYPLLALSSIYNFSIRDNLSTTISETPEIFIENVCIIPLFHPAAQIKSTEQLNQYDRIWNKIKK
jgi:uracil-DNA glycosylase family 4